MMRKETQGRRSFVATALDRISREPRELVRHRQIKRVAVRLPSSAPLSPRIPHRPWDFPHVHNYSSPPRWPLGLARLQITGNQGELKQRAAQLWRMGTEKGPRAGNGIGKKGKRGT